ncbi:nuclear receptor-binding factor 2-like [Armigeres subalbatus]|uniref:nuclear receptor-binding factor 2-like n=1 Tax=Armigeres subalbatus TaxID=124917 RepID=UPI002ED1AB5C
MENSFLNMAHVYGRRAEHHSKHRRFDEAIENHRKAASYIEEALKIAPQSAVVIESLQLQRKYHQKQVEFVRHRKQQYERYMKALEYQRKRNPEFLAKQLEKMDKYSELQVAIYQNLDETDSLLETMAQNSNEHRMPAVEDLITLNHSLHVLVHRMTQNIDEYVTENETLKETLNLYRNDAGDKTAANRRLDREHNVRIASVETDRDVMEVNDYHQKGLPALAPLELPTFDLPEFEGN